MKTEKPKSEKIEDAKMRKAKKDALKIHKAFKGIRILIEDCIGVCAPPFQRKIIQLVIENREPKEDVGDMKYFVEKLKNIFNGLPVPVRNVFLNSYLKNVLPPLEAEHNKEIAEQDATDELLNLTIGKSVQQIKAMIEMLKANGFSKKYKKCG
ncbi:MAG: hypothetical protein WCE45_08515 [Sedimentisphaerales bacterium]